MSTGRRCLVGLVSSACLVVAATFAFQVWRSGPLHHLGMILVGSAMPWLWFALELDLFRGYWGHVVALWIGLSLNVTVAIVLLSWARRRSTSGVGPLTHVADVDRAGPTT